MILAQATGQVGLLISILIVFVGIGGVVMKHTSNADRHPNKTNIVYKDVCDAQIKRQDERHAELKADISEIKADVKTLLSKG